MIFEYFRHRSLKQDLVQIKEATKDGAEQRHQELIDIRSVLNSIKMEPLGNAGRVGRLPDGTNIVETAKGQVLLALPVRISRKGSATFNEGSARLTRTTQEKDTDCS